MHESCGFCSFPDLDDGVDARPDIDILVSLLRSSSVLPLRCPAELQFEASPRLLEIVTPASSIFSRFVDSDNRQRPSKSCVISGLFHLSHYSSTSAMYFSYPMNFNYFLNPISSRNHSRFLVVIQQWISPRNASTMGSADLGISSTLISISANA